MTANWSITVEIECDDGEGPSQLRLSVRSVYGDGKRPLDECVALDMGHLMKMIQESAHIMNPGSGLDAIKAFEDAWS